MPKTAGFVAGNKLLAKKWDDYQYKIHARKLENMQPRVSIRPPRQFPHMVLRLKQVQREEERQANIDKSNQILLQKMTTIMKHKGRVDNWNDYHSRSLNQAVREKRLDEIAAKNLEFAKRLECIHPIYDVGKWEDDYHNKHEYYQDMWSKDTKVVRGVKTSPRRTGDSPPYSYRGDFDGDSDGDTRTNSVRMHRLDGVTRSEGSVFSVHTKLPKIKAGKDAVVEQDAKLLFKASKQLVKPQDALSKALIKRTQGHRMNVKAKFTELYDLDLLTELKGCTASALHPLVECLLAERDLVDAEALNSAIYDNDLNELVILLCSRTPAALASIKKAYNKAFECTIDEDIEDKIVDRQCQVFAKILVKSGRSSSDADEQQADQDALDLFEAGADRFDGESCLFLRLLASQSFAQMKAMFTSFKMVAGGENIVKVMEKDGCSKDFCQVISTLNSCLFGNAAYYADQIQENLEPGSKELINLLLVQSEMDMPGIRKAYSKKYGTELLDAILKKCGDSGPLLAQIAAKGTQAASKGKSGRSRTTTTMKMKKEPAPLHKAKSIPNTITAASNFNPDNDAKRIREAMDRWDSDQGPLIEVLTGRSNSQRQEIKKRYSNRYKEELLSALQHRLPPEYEEVIVGLLHPTAEYQAYCLHSIITQEPANMAAIIGLVGVLNDKDLHKVQEVYKKRYGAPLADDITGEKDTEFKRLLREILSGQRDQGTAVNPQQSMKDADKLYNNGETVLDLASGDFVTVMTKRSLVQLREVLVEYKKLAKQDLTEGIREAMTGEEEAHYIALVQLLHEPVDFFARQLHELLKGGAGNSAHVVRILILRSEIDLGDIKAKYKQLYKKSLGDTLSTECTADYRPMLLAVMGEK